LKWRLIPWKGNQGFFERISFIFSDRAIFLISLSRIEAVDLSGADSW
jgi:hypothetical protein